MTCVVDAVTSEFVIVRVRSAAAAMLTEVKTAWPAREFMTIGEAAAPVAVLALNVSPFPAVEETKLPLVAVIFPRVAVTVVPAATVETAATVPAVRAPPFKFKGDAPPVVYSPRLINAVLRSVVPIGLTIAVAPKKPIVEDATPTFTTEEAPVPNEVLPVESSVVACTGRGVVEPKPRTGGEAKSSAVAESAVAGEMYTLVRTPAAASAAVAARTVVFCVVGVPVTPGG